MKAKTALTVILSACLTFGIGAVAASEFDRSGQPLLITIHYAKDKHQLDRIVMDIKKFQMDEAQSGAAFWSPNDNICEVFVIRPRPNRAYEMATLGHEVYHCTNGKFH